MSGEQPNSNQQDAGKRSVSVDASKITPDSATRSTANADATRPNEPIAPAAAIPDDELSFSTQPGNPADLSLSDSGSLSGGVAVSRIAIGSQFGPYRLLEKLGQGGMGLVFKAEHTHLGKIVAIKVLPHSVMENPDSVNRFKREMKAVGGISHPHIIQALDAGELNGVHFLVMEYFEGNDLQDVVEESGPLSVVNSCRIIWQAALGLAAAHEQGMVHRDVKPSNLFLSKIKKQIKLLDLGLARLSLDNTAGGLTLTGQYMGTPDYMSPEQCKDARTVDGRTDQYALGCTLYFLLTGRAPYATDEFPNAFGKMTAHVFEPIPDLRAARADVPREVAEIYVKLMAKQPLERFASCGELAAVLEPHCSPRSSTRGDAGAPKSGPLPEVKPVKELPLVPSLAMAPFDAAAAKRHQATWAEFLGKKIIDRNSLGMEFVLIPPGKFLMGSSRSEIEKLLAEDKTLEHEWFDSETPQVEVTLTKPIYLGISALTQAQWLAVMGTTPWEEKAFVKEGPNYPATYVSWEDVQEFYVKLSKQDGQCYRLPTEAEWEYACRAGTVTRYSSGDDASKLSACGWWGELLADGIVKGALHAHEVGLKPANPFGLCDMHGNVWEWCQDAYPEKLLGGTNPLVEKGAPFRVFRGGSWCDEAKLCRSAYRSGDTPRHRSISLGFRVVRVP